MERETWTDERLDERMTAIDHSFDRLHEEMRALRSDFREEMRALRTEFREDMRGLRSDFSRLQDRLVQIGFGLVFALIAAVIALIVALTS